LTHLSFCLLSFWLLGYTCFLSSLLITHDRQATGEVPAMVPVRTLRFVPLERDGLVVAEAVDLG